MIRVRYQFDQENGKMLLANLISMKNNIIKDLGLEPPKEVLWCQSLEQFLENLKTLKNMTSAKGQPYPLDIGSETILQGKGSISAEIAKAFTQSEFEKYRALQDKDYQSDFDKLSGHI